MARAFRLALAFFFAFALAFFFAFYFLVSEVWAPAAKAPAGRVAATMNIAAIVRTAIAKTWDMRLERAFKVLSWVGIRGLTGQLYSPSWLHNPPVG